MLSYFMGYIDLTTRRHVPEYNLSLVTAKIVLERDAV